LNGLWHFLPAKTALFHITASLNIACHRTGDADLCNQRAKLKRFCTGMTAEEDSCLNPVNFPPISSVRERFRSSH
jgi:hypothetical protein